MQVNFLNTLNSIAKTNSSFGAKHFGVDENGTRKSELVINNPCGIHSRPSSNIVKLTLLPKEPQDVYVCSETKGKII